MDSNQEAFIHDNPGNVQSFLDAVKTIKPTAIIGKFNVEVHVSILAGKTLIYSGYKKSTHPCSNASSESRPESARTSVV